MGNNGDIRELSPEKLEKSPCGKIPMPSVTVR